MFLSKGYVLNNPLNFNIWRNYCTPKLDWPAATVCLGGGSGGGGGKGLVAGRILRREREEPSLRALSPPLPSSSQSILPPPLPFAPPHPPSPMNWRIFLVLCNYGPICNVPSFRNRTVKKILGKNGNNNLALLVLMNRTLKYGIGQGKLDTIRLHVHCT